MSLTTMNNCLLLISDNLSISQDLINDLKEHDCDVQSAEFSKIQANIVQETSKYTLIIFDVHHHIEWIREALQKLKDHQHIRFLILSASDKEQDCLDAFSAGADDYLKKPFVLAECVARIKALLRRAHTPSLDNAVLKHGELVLNCLTRQAVLENHQLNLTNSQFNLLEIFLRYPGRVLSKEQLTEYSLGRKYTAYDRSIDVHVSHLRHKLGEDHHDESWIQTIRGYGYSFVAKG
jgi:two-component system response regulator CpxR